MINSKPTNWADGIIDGMICGITKMRDGDVQTDDRDLQSMS
jgi:hypothetical protein